ncbi:hypothetical protein [Dactylosporangium sp. CA-233914]|uniref:hypothetical protein n=1 Tax=Dactylosporangium sp. CA-233914 TaxID=3239934 RepID=UPI003D8E1321
MSTPTTTNIRSRMPNPLPFVPEMADVGAGLQVEAVLAPNPAGERVPDELYATASAHYDDIPGMPAGQNFSELERRTA